MGWAGKEGEKNTGKGAIMSAQIRHFHGDIKTPLQKRFILRICGRNEVRTCTFFLRQDISLQLSITKVFHKLCLEASTEVVFPLIYYVHPKHHFQKYSCLFVDMDCSTDNLGSPWTCVYVSTHSHTQVWKQRTVELEQQQKIFFKSLEASLAGMW